MDETIASLGGYFCWPEHNFDRTRVELLDKSFHSIGYGTSTWRMQIVGGNLQSIN